MTNVTMLNLRPGVTPLLDAECANCAFRWRDDSPCVCPLCGYRHLDGEFTPWERRPETAPGIDTAATEC